MATTEAEVVRDLAYEAQEPTELEPGKYYAWINRDGTLAEKDLTDNLPVFKTGTVQVHDVEAFTTYFDKHHDEGSEIYADLDAATITAVLDAHTTASDIDNGARWQRHRLVFALRETLPWKTWVAKDRKPMGQRDFAEFLEDNYRDLAPADQQPKADGQPVIDPAGLLELAQQFSATLKAEFHEGHRLATGQTSLSYIETVNGGHKDKTIDAPTEFAVAIAPFDDCDEALIIARFRYRVERDGSGVSFQYVLTNPDRRRREAVEEVVAKTATATGWKIILGQPSA